MPGLPSAFEGHPALSGEPGAVRALREGLEAATHNLGVRGGAPRFERVPLYPKQAAIVDDEMRFTITEATTKAGKTMSHIEWLLERGAERGYGNSWWVATVGSTAAIAFRRVQDRLRGYIDSGAGPQKVAEPTPFEKNETEKWIEAFGVRFWFKSADKPDSLFGEDVYDAVGDEVTRWKEAAWHALYTTLTATRGRAKLIGNVKGRRNFAYRLARKAEEGERGWSHHKLTAYDAIEGGVIDAETVEQAQRDLPPHVFQELFLAEPADDEGNPFGLDAIRACIAPLSTEEPVAWGWDLAKSVDWTVGVGLDRDGRVCRFVRFQKPWSDTRARIRRETGKVAALVDSTGVGDPVLEELQREGGRNFDGFKFTGPSKQQLMEGLAVGIQCREVLFPDGPIRSELDAFEYEYTRTGVRYSAPSGLHDDCVCALALAREKWVEVTRRGRIRGGFFPGVSEDEVQAEIERMRKMQGAA